MPPLAVAAKVKGALRLAALDEAAERLGLIRGQPLADARAMIPALEAIEEDGLTDHALLESLASWAERYTPIVTLDPDNGLILDITGAAHLFGGETGLIADVGARLQAQGFFVRRAIAGTPGAASAAARFGNEAIIAEGGTTEMLKPLPLAALRLDGETVAALDRVGLKRIGQIMDAPRGPLTARFGSLLLRRLDQALDLEEEALSPHRPLPVLIAERRFAEPVSREDDIAATLASLTTTLAKGLEERGEGARGLELSLFRVDGHVARSLIGTGRPVRKAKLVLDLFREKFAGLGEEIDAGFGFDMIRLSVTAAAPFDNAQTDLAGDAVGESDLGQLIDRIGVRLGAEHVGRIETRDSHVPERAEAFVMGEEERRKTIPPHSPFPSAPLERPLRLFARPEPVEAIGEVPDGPPVTFRWRRVLYRIARAEGPERIGAEWWRGEDFTRDYFRVEDFDGRRFWLFREGIYTPETPEPRWYLHGMFG
jgi:protein ImuB